MAGGAERAAKARLTVEMGREQNELDRQEAEAVARIQAGKGTGLKLKDQLDIFVKLFGEVKPDFGNDSDKAMEEMRRLHPILTKTFEDFSGGNAPSTGQEESFILEFKKLNPDAPEMTNEEILLQMPKDY